MANLLDKTVLGAQGNTCAVALSPPIAPRPAAARVACFHCGEPCPDHTFSREERVFCCQGCLVVHDLLAETGLTHFYELNRHPGIRLSTQVPARQWDYLEETEVQQKLLDFTDGKVSRVTFHIPAIHCVACVWLLENLFRLHPGIGRSQVNFPRREVSISFSAAKIRLAEVAALLSSIGYVPRLTLGELDKPVVDPGKKRRWLQVGLAGFAFGNIMLFSLPGYLGLDSLSGPTFRAVFGYLSLALALPVLLYSASDYWRSALLSFRQRILTLDVPIALGLCALYAQSAYEILSGTGEGYLDSLSGLIFFLLCGRVFQQQTYERIAFDRDYKCFFPLSATRLEAGREQSVSISSLVIGDRLRLRNGELIPADGKLLSGAACIDYSFVTGESEPLSKSPGDYLYAGGKQVGGAIELQIVKPVSQSYLTSLWDDEAFRKTGEDTLNTLTNRYSRRFTIIVVFVAVAAALLWLCLGQGARGLKAFTSVLIVACPCALALAAPFTLGTGQRLLARIQVFLKNSHLLEKLARVNTVIFDKTGTLTEPGTAQPEFEPAGATQPLSCREAAWLRTLAAQSTHPHSAALARTLAGDTPAPEVSEFREIPGAGTSGSIDGHRVLLGSGEWLRQHGIAVAEAGLASASRVLVAIDGKHRGTFLLSSRLRPEMDELIPRLTGDYEVSLLSGDNERERDRFARLFGSGCTTLEPDSKVPGSGHDRLHFNQSPGDKLAHVRRLQRQGRNVMMVGDGLNDAGALKQSDVGVAVVEKVGAFSPASDVVLPADRVGHLHAILKLSTQATRTVRWGFAISAAYNVVGVGIAAAGILSPIICAILMPTSSVSVVLFACWRMHRAARRLGIVPADK